jgi:hypothetical protein
MRNSNAVLQEPIVDPAEATRQIKSVTEYKSFVASSSLSTAAASRLSFTVAIEFSMLKADAEMAKKEMTKTLTERMMEVGECVSMWSMCDLQYRSLPFIFLLFCVVQYSKLYDMLL